MANWWHYLLLVNIYLLLFYGFYALLLRKETFFQLNRVYLVSAALLSFFIPMVQADWVRNLFITEQVRYTLYSGTAINFTAVPIEKVPLTVGQVFAFLYLSGIVLLTVKFFLQLIKVKRIINEPEPSAAYSFFNKISLGENLIKQDAVIAHEQVHARQWHTLDVLIIEIVMILNWFNPVVYLYRFAIKHIHEFIADQQALRVGADKAGYALLLLSQSFNVPTHNLVNPFYNHSLLKQRIMMLQKNRSQRIVLFKYVLSAPLFGLMLILSSATVNNSRAVNTINNKVGDLFEKQANTVITSLADSGQIPDHNLTDETATAAVTTNLEPTLADTLKRDKVYERVDVIPSFSGGLNTFYSFLGKTIRYPAEARENNITGRVLIGFIVEKDGSLSNIKALRGPGHGLNEEAARAISLSPKWTSGVKYGKAVRAYFTVPIIFTLNADNKSVDTVMENKLMPSLQTATMDANNNVFESVETEPAFPGGIQQFYNFLSKTIRYPAEARANNIQGKVFVQFVVEKDGSLSDVKAVRGPGAGINEEAVRAISLSPKWTRGVQNGRAVRVKYTVPVNFTLNDNTRSTYSGSAQIPPLYIVDGIEVDNTNTIKANDIASISVLKGENAKALYGEKGKNGVIVVTTKKARENNKTKNN